MTTIEVTTVLPRRARVTPARRRPNRVVVGLLWLAIAGVLGGNGFILSQRHVTTKVTFDDALRAFRRAPGPTTPSDAAAATRFVAPAAPATTASEPSATGVAHQPIAAPASAPAPPAAAAVPFTRPAPGVYAYRTTGGDSISVAGASHHYPAETYATVKQLDGCQWEIRNDVIAEHMDRRVMCSQAGSLLQILQERQVEFYGKRDGLVLECQPPALMSKTGETVGTTSAAVCRSSDTEARLQRTVVEEVRLTVGGKAVDTVHIVIDGKFSGRATGSSHDELWLTKDTGMTVRWDRTVDTLADAAFGAQVRYQEQATFLLESLTPKT